MKKEIAMTASNQPAPATLELAQVRLDGGTQIRTRLRKEVVREYAERMAEGACFPPIGVYFDGQRYWLADGFHRVAAALELGRATIDCLVYHGTLREALLAAIGANQGHGLRRNNDDKRRAVETLLADAEWAAKTDRWIAEICGVSHPFVAKLRDQVVTVTNRPAEGESRERQGQNGKSYRVRERRADQAVTEAEKDDPLDFSFDSAMRAAAGFDACVEQLGRLVDEGERLACGSGGGYLQYRAADYRQYLESAAQLLRDTKPLDRCYACRGDGCPRCRDCGYLCLNTE
jgi:hypothetical protein